MDLSTYFLGPVRGVYTNPAHEWKLMPYDGPIGAFFGRFMAFYNRRLVCIAQERVRKGIYGLKNHGHFLAPRMSMSPDTSAGRLLFDGIMVWLKAEISTWMAPAPAKDAVMMSEKPVTA
jgi:hypothetical protein